MIFKKILPEVFLLHLPGKRQRPEKKLPVESLDYSDMRKDVPANAGE